MLAAFEDALATLCADARVRRDFARDRDAALATFALAPRELAALRALDLDELDRFARALVAKRWSDVARVVPLALRVAPRLGASYRAWLAEHPAPAHASRDMLPASSTAEWRCGPIDSPLAPGVAEALRALPVLRAALEREPNPAYASELCAFEILRAAARGDGEPRALATRFAIHAIADDVARGLLPTEPAPAAHDYVFERDRVRRRLRA